MYIQRSAKGVFPRTVLPPLENLRGQPHLANPPVNVSRTVESRERAKATISVDIDGDDGDDYGLGRSKTARLPLAFILLHARAHTHAHIAS